MLALVKTRRWLSFTALVVLAIIGFGLLSRWQWDRADERRVERIAISQAQILDRVDSVTDLGEFTRVQVSGNLLMRTRSWYVSGHSMAGMATG